jgi:uncharacterized protein (UPF0179 family)
MNTNTITITCNAATAAYAEIARLINLANLDMSVAKFRTDIKSTNLYWVKRDGHSEWSYRGGRDVDGNLLTVAGLLATNITSIIEVVKGEGRSVILNIVEVAPATPVETTTVDNTAPVAELKMPFNPLQNNAMFHNQIRQFLGTDCTVEKVATARWYDEGKKYRVITVAGVVYEVVLNDDFYVFTQVETATQTTVATATPAVETTAATPATAPAAELKMPVKPLQTNAMLHNQIREFLGTKHCTVEEVATELDENKKYRVTTAAGVAYEVVLNSDFHVFTQVETAKVDNTAPAAPSTPAGVTMPVIEVTPAQAIAEMPAAAESQMTESEMSAFRDNLEKLSPKQLLVSLVEISAAKRHLESLSQGEAGESPFHKLAREVWITSDQMTMVDQYQKIGLPTRLINMPSESTEAAEIIPEVSTDKTEVMPEVEVATTEAATPDSETDKVEMATIVTPEEAVESFIADTGMADSPITRCRIWVMLSRAGLGDYRVSKRRPEQLLPCDLADPIEPETNVIIDPDGNEVWDAGWASWKERTQRFIETRAKMATEDLEYAKAHMEYDFCLIGNRVAYQNAIANQIATEYADPKRGTVLPIPAHLCREG